MQTFLPDVSFKKTAQILDYRRLGKQRVEARQILNTIQNQNGWKNHPIVKMWTGYEEALKLYGNYIILEWKIRGYNNSMPLLEVKPNVKLPHWLGREEFHASHRAALLFKDYEYYKIFNWKEKPELNYVWYAWT